MDKKFIVPFQTARQLREKGYSGENDYFWDANRLKPRRVASQKRSGIQIFSMNNNVVYMLENKPFDSKCFVECTAPTYHEVVDWLEEKGLRIHVECCVYWSGLIDKYETDEFEKTGLYNTREEALNASILKALEML